MSESLPRAPTVPAGVLDLVKVRVAGNGVRTIITPVGPLIVAAKVARLRQQAEHCRRLSNCLYDERMRSALDRLAHEYDEHADQLESIGSDERAR